MKEMYGDQFGEFVCGYWGLKGQSFIQIGGSSHCLKFGKFPDTASLKNELMN